MNQLKKLWYKVLNNFQLGLYENKTLSTVSVISTFPLCFFKRFFSFIRSRRTAKSPPCSPLCAPDAQHWGFVSSGTIIYQCCRGNGLNRASWLTINNNLRPFFPHFVFSSFEPSEAWRLQARGRGGVVVVGNQTAKTLHIKCGRA